MAFVSLSKMPTPPATRVANIPSMPGGLNIHDLPWQLAENQSPEMKNMWWEDGALRTRPGQYKQAEFQSEINASSQCAAYPHPYKGYYFFHIGTKMWAVNENWMGSIEVPYKNELNSTVGEGLPNHKGTFFLYDGKLYYKTRGAYVAIEEVVDELEISSIVARTVETFVPTLLINADPNEKGAGDLYQPLNRLNQSYYVLYNADAGDYRFVTPLDLTSVTEAEEGKVMLVSEVAILDNRGEWKTLAHGVEYQIVSSGRRNSISVIFNDDYKGLITEDGYNNVRIKCFSQTKESLRTLDSIHSCDIVTVYGGSGGGSCAVFAGCEEQPNAYFWSANTDVSMDPTYIPETNYNLAGDFSDPITAFGQQQNQLVIFQKSRVGAAAFGTTEIDGRTSITMNYRTINPSIGCDVPGSVQLVENNLVFANKRHGVMLIRDTTSANENNLVPISINVEKASEDRGVLYDLKNTTAEPTSFDDGERYWLIANRHAWVWDYRLNNSVSNPANLSWFYFDNIQSPACWFGAGSLYETYFINGSTVYTFKKGNHGETFEASVALPVLNFGTYEVLKNVTKAIFAFDDSSEGTVEIEYKTDYGTRADPTPINFSAAEDTPFAEVFVRKPRCLNVRHFLCRLTHRSANGQRMAFTSAQIHYTMQGVDR